MASHLVVKHHERRVQCEGEQAVGDDDGGQRHRGSEA